MDPLTLAEKLEALRRCVVRIEDRRADSAQVLVDDVDRQDILSLNLTTTVQLCVAMAVHVLSATEGSAPRTMGDAFKALAAQGWIEQALAARMRAAVGFRNVAVHNYRNIDWNIVHVITHEGLADFRDFAASMARVMADGNARPKRP